MRIDYRLRFEEYWRVGSGEGAGRHLDALVRRDGYGLPFVPGTTIRGVVRDAVGVVAELTQVVLCDGTLKKEGTLCGVRGPAGPCPRCVLFGSPYREGGTSWQPARLELESSAMGVGDRRHRLSKQVLYEPALVVRAHPRTAVDLRSGRADDEKLFTTEEANRELTLSGHIDLLETVGSLEVALLVAGLRWVRELGGGRRRGLGAVRFDIADGQLGTFSDWREALAHLHKPGLPHVISEGPTAVPQTPAQPVDVGRTEVFQVEARVVGEVVIARQPDAGNLIPGALHVPGSALRGALAQSWSGDRAGDDFAACFLSGNVRFGFLYPVFSGDLSFPQPLSWHTCKVEPGADGHGKADLLVHPRQSECAFDNCGAGLQPWRPPPRPERFDRLHQSPHNSIDSTTQTVAGQALFAYEALPEGMTLRGFVRASSADLLGRLLGGLGIRSLESGQATVPLRVGRRRHSLGYLECLFTRIAGQDDGALYPGETCLPRAGRRLRIDLLTPAILLDRTDLRYRTALEPADLGLLSRRSFDAAYGAWQLLYGWHSTQRLPKPSQVAIAAGSSYRIDAPTAEEIESLRKAAKSGIGLRIDEGFGAIAVRTMED